jgi:hypothetical protein
MSESTLRRWKTKHESGQLVSSKEKMGKVNEKRFIVPCLLTPKQSKLISISILVQQALMYAIF